MGARSGEVALVAHIAVAGGEVVSRMNDIEDNDTAQSNLARIVVESVLRMPYEPANVTIGPLSTNYYSFVFSLEVSSSAGSQRVFVKIPKQDLRQGPKNILHIQPGDRQLAQDERDALRTLGAEWHTNDLMVSWVTLRGEVPQYNALVTDAVEAQDALLTLRRWDLRWRMGSTESRQRLASVMTRFGTALGRFHQAHAHPILLSLKPSIPKFARYCREISPYTRSSLLQRTMSTIRTLSERQRDAKQVLTLKGIDIRNILMDEEGRLSILDPGRLKLACREADLARFIVTFRLLYWGRPLFLLGLRPDSQAERAFLEAYYASTSPPSSTLLGLFLIKEQLKHWHDALQSLEMLPWSRLTKRIVARVYVNRYYAHALSCELDGVR